MPRKQSEEVEVAETAEAPALVRKADAGVCGHENKHFKGGHKMTCTLPKGHDPEAVVREVLDAEKKLVLRTTYEVIHRAPYTMTKHGVSKEAIASWSNEAGTAPHK